MIAMKRRVMNCLVWSFVGLLMTAGCGDDALGPVTCPVQFTACGGEVVGVWRVVEDCVPFTNASCSDAPLIVDQRTFITYTFNSDGSFSRTESGETKYHFTEPSRCHSWATSCDQLSTMSGKLRATCSGDAAVECRCDVTLSAQDSRTGTYSVAGNTISVKATTGDFDFDYCVQGTRLLLHDAVLPSPIVLERQ